MRVLLVLFMVWMSASAGYAAAGSACKVETTSGHDQVVCRAKSEAGKGLRLIFDAQAVTTDTTEATLCSEPAAAADEATLWMPDMSHGSGPTTLTNGTDGCTTVADIDFLMSGLWQIKAHFPGDGDKGVIDVDVAR